METHDEKSMSPGIQLVTLKCRNCGSALNAENQSLLLFCAACGSGYEISSGQDLQPVQVYFAHQDAPVYFPFWAFDAKLHLQEREAKKALFGNPKGLAALFAEKGTIRFYAPAFLEDLELEEPRSLQLTLQQPDLTYIHHLPQLPRISVSMKDAEKIARHLLITSEVGQKDTLRRIEFTLDLQHPFLIVIGFTE